MTAKIFLRRADSPTPRRVPRLRLKPDTVKTGYVDGAWWPRSHDLVTELSTLLPALTGRLGSIRRVVFRRGDWATTPNETTAGGASIRLDAFRSQPVNTFEVLGVGGRRLTLLVVPPYTEADHAYASMAAAANRGNDTPVDILLSPSAPRARQHVRG